MSLFAFYRVNDSSVVCLFLTSGRKYWIVIDCSGFEDFNFKSDCSGANLVVEVGTITPKGIHWRACSGKIEIHGAP